MSFPRKRESGATATSLALDPGFRGGDSPREMRKQQAFDLILAPMRGRVRGLARQREETSLCRFARTRGWPADSSAPAGARPLTLPLSHKGRGDSAWVALRQIERWMHCYRAPK